MRGTRLFRPYIQSPTHSISYLRLVSDTFDATATGIAQILVNGQGENMIIIIAGANGKLTPLDVCGAESAIAGAAVLMVRWFTYVCTFVISQLWFARLCK